MSEPLTRSEVAEIVREEARAIALQVLAERTIPDFPAYFFQKNWIVTYDWMYDADQQLSNRIIELHQRILRLERPWWRRWFSR